MEQLAPILYILVGPILCTYMFFGTMLTVALWQHLRRRHHLTRVRKAWQQTQQAIRHGPVVADYYRSKPNDAYPQVRRGFGVLGLVDDQLIFVPRGSTVELVITFETLRWVGTRKFVTEQNDDQEKYGLVVHYEIAEQEQENTCWHVIVFLFYSDAVALSFAHKLSQLTGLAEHHLENASEDYGPDRAAPMIQDVYGQWQPATNKEHQRRFIEPDETAPAQLAQGDLYLAPDRLLFDYQYPILYSQVKRLDVYHTEGLTRLNPFSENLLRIEYETPDGGHRVVGFLLRRAETWGNLIHEHTGAPLETHAGRKKKTN